jgi:hypothetical protein
MGRPPGRIQDRIFRMRASEAFLKSVDAWRRKQPDLPTRSEAIRRIVEHALGPSPANRRSNKRKAQKASELAGRAVEGVVDKSMPMEEQQRRKRAVIKGPKEFREIREDLPKSKR